MGRTRVNYDELTVTFVNEPSEEVLLNYYSKLVDYLINKFGSEPVRIALEELINED